jgi:hypothetical protein
MTFDLIAPEQLHAWWQYVREGLERVKVKGKEKWFVEDVYTAIRTKRSTLYIARDEDKPIGFFVAEMSIEPFSNEHVLFVWCLFGMNELSHTDECIEYLDRLAHSIGAKRIRFTGRHGWSRVLKGKFTDVRRIYERELT